MWLRLRPRLWTETGTETATESAAETEAEAAPDMEVFFTFTWGRNRAQSKPKGQGRRFSDGPAKEAASNTGDTAKNDGRSGSNSRKGRRNKPDGEQAAQDRAGLKKSGQSRQTTPGQQKRAGTNLIEIKTANPERVSSVITRAKAICGLSKEKPTDRSGQSICRRFNGAEG